MLSDRSTDTTWTQFNRFVCLFYKGPDIFRKSTSNVSLNLSIDIGRHDCSLGWSENLS